MSLENPSCQLDPLCGSINSIIDTHILNYQTLSIQSADYVIFDNIPVVSDNRVRVRIYKTIFPKTVTNIA